MWSSFNVSTSLFNVRTTPVWGKCAQNQCCKRIHGGIMFQPWLHHQSGQAYLFVHKINPQLCAINLKGWWAPYRWQDQNKQVESGKLLQMTTTTCDQFLGLEKSYCNSSSLPFFFLKFHYTINKNFTVNLQWIEITSVNPPGPPPPIRSHYQSAQRKMPQPLMKTNQCGF